MSAADPTDIWAWTYEDLQRLEREGGQKLQIVRGWRRFWNAYHNDDEAADFAINEALAAAKAEGELRWELLLRHWRLQLWLRGDAERALPEAVDLLTLATDERLRDVPQRICAFHDVVECHICLDPAGYYQDIVANATDILGQLPARHQCADCARLHYAIAAASSGRVAEADLWLGRLATHMAAEPSSVWGPSALGGVLERLERWDDAEREFLRLHDIARKEERGNDYLESLVGISRARIAKGDLRGAFETLHEARRMSKYTGSRFEQVHLLEVEGQFAESNGEFSVATDYFTRAAHQYLDLGRYRNAALVALHAVEAARARGEESAEEALALAAEAAGHMPPSSQDIFERLSALGHEPRPPARDDAAQGDAAQGDAAQGDAARSRELAALEDTLAGRLAHRDASGTAVALYRIGRWHARHQQPRAAVDYFIANALLERLLELPMRDREDALDALRELRQDMPDGTVAAALTAAEAGPTGQLAPLVGEVKPMRWRWLVRSLAAEVAGQPVVEPEPRELEGREGFEAWLEHVASMTALIVRFRQRLDPSRAERWASALDEMAASMRQHLGPNGEGKETTELVETLARLGRGTDLPTPLLEHVAPLVEQIQSIAAEPVWRHPGSTPLDFLVEHSAQRAVRALRLQDDGRASRLANLQWRFELMNLDLLEDDRLRPIGRFLEALQGLLERDGETLPPVEPPLEAPFDAVLSAVFAAGQTEGDN